VKEAFTGQGPVKDACTDQGLKRGGGLRFLGSIKYAASGPVDCCASLQFYVLGLKCYVGYRNSLRFAPEGRSLKAEVFVLHTSIFSLLFWAHGSKRGGGLRFLGSIKCAASGPVDCCASLQFYVLGLKCYVGYRAGLRFAPEG